MYKRQIAVMALGVSLLSGCAGKSLQAQQDDETIQVYLWTTGLYEKYAPYAVSYTHLLPTPSYLLKKNLYR